MTAPKGERGRTGVALLGSTGSIGRQTIDVLASGEAADYEVVALAAGRDAASLSEQARLLHPQVVSLADPEAARRLQLPDGAARDDAPRRPGGAAGRRNRKWALLDSNQ